MNIVQNDIVNSLLIIILMVVLLLYRRSLFSNEKHSRIGFFVMWAVLTLFSVFYIVEGGDNYSLYLNYENYMQSGTEHHLETLYFRIADIIPNNYYLYRFVIWGLASLFLVLTCKQLNSDSNLGICVMICVCLMPCFYYLRNSLGICMVFYVVARITTFKMGKSKSIFKEVMIDLIIVWLSIYTHSSMPMYILLAALALIIPINNLFLALVVLLVGIVSFYGQEIALLLFRSDIFSGDAVELGMGYVLGKDEAFAFNTLGKLWRFIWLAPYAVMLIYATIVMYKDKTISRSPQKVFLVLSDILFFGSFFLASSASHSLAYRLQNTSFLPISLFLLLFVQDKRKKTWCKVFWIWILVYTGLSFIWSLKL